jgi:hypothetical protein
MKETSSMTDSMVLTRALDDETATQHKIAGLHAEVARCEERLAEVVAFIKLYRQYADAAVTGETAFSLTYAAE